MTTNNQRKSPPHVQEEVRVVCDKAQNDQQSQQITESQSKVQNSKLKNQDQERAENEGFMIYPAVPNGIIPKNIDKQLQESKEKLLENKKKVNQVFDQVKNTKVDNSIIFQQPQPDKQKEEELDEHIKSVFVQVGIIPKWMLTRTSRCKHKHSCYENVAYGFTSTLVYSLAIKVILNNLGYLANPRKLLRNLVSWKSQKDNLRFAFFLALMNGVYKLVLCLMRRLVKSDKIASLVAGFLAGLSCRLDAMKRRQLLTVLLMSRVSESAFAMGEKRGYVKRISYGEFYIWLICNVFQQYAMACEPDTLNPGQYKFQRHWSLLSKMPTYSSISDALTQSVKDGIAARAKPGQIVNFGK